MHTCLQLLNEYQRKLGLSSDNQTAKALGVSRAAVSKWRNGETIGDEIALKIADALGYPRDYVLICCHAERAQANEAKKVLTKLASRLRGAAAILAILSFAAIGHQEVQAADSYKNNGQTAYILCEVSYKSHRELDVRPVPKALTVRSLWNPGPDRPMRTRVPTAWILSVPWQSTIEIWSCPSALNPATTHQAIPCIDCAA